MGKHPKRVSFSAYCRAFESLDENAARAICRRLDPSEEVYSVAYLEMDRRGDGTVSVPEYRVEAGRLKVAGFRFLTEVGNFLRRNGVDDTLLGTVDPEFAGYFIAGAFGMSELVNGSSIDFGIVLGLQNVYKRCLHNSESCLGSEAAKDVSRGFKEFVAAREEKAKAEMARDRMEGKKSDVSRMQTEFNRRIFTVRLKEEERSRIAMFRMAMPVIFSREEDYDMAINLFRLMFGVIDGAEAIIPSANYAQREDADSD